MATLTIRDLDESLKRELRMRAASRNRSMEEEARQILRAALREPVLPAADMATRIRARFAGLGDVVMSLPEREPVRSPPVLDSAVKVSSSKRAPATRRPK